MHKILKFAAATLAAVMVMGCQQEQKPAAPSQSALDVRPIQKPAPTYSLSPQQVTPPDEPRVEVVTTVTPGFHPAPDASRPAKNAKSVKESAQQGNSYKVKKGDTLYHIAKTEYGDGKKWTMIASANPGVSPQSLKAGQTLMIP